MFDIELIEALREKQIVIGFQPDGFGGVKNIYGPDPVTAEAADRIEALGDEIDALTADAVLREYERHAERARIDALTAERDMALAEWDDCVERNRPRSVADTTAMTDLIAEIEFQAVDGEINCDLAKRIITALRALTAVQSHVNETLKSEHEACDMLTPAKGDA